MVRDCVFHARAVHQATTKHLVGDCESIPLTSDKVTDPGWATYRLHFRSILFASGGWWYDAIRELMSLFANALL